MSDKPKPPAAADADPVPEPILPPAPEKPGPSTEEWPWESRPPQHLR